MLRKKSLLLVLALTVLMTFAFSACGSSASNNDSSTSTSSSVLRVGIDDTYPPMEYKDEAGNHVGFDIELAQAIGKKLNKEVQFVPTAWTAIFTALSSNKYDCIISSLSITEDRKKTIAYTKPYVANSQCIIVKADNTTTASEKDLGDKIVAVQMGTTSDEACVEFQKSITFKDYKKYEAMTEALSELKIGRVDAVVCDLVIGKYFVAKDKGSFKTVATTLPNEPIGIGFTKANQAEAEKFDKLLDEMRKDGTLKAISEKWFGEDMTQNIAE
jgi:polar amino acid transport system substrate-binding protein